MQVKYGKLLTNRRNRIVREYMNARIYFWKRHSIGPHTHWGRYADWANDFERFMLHGYGKGKDESRVATRRDVAHETPHLEKPTVADARGPNRPTAQVD